MATDGPPLRPGEKIVWQQEVDLSEGTDIADLIHGDPQLAAVWREYTNMSDPLALSRDFREQQEYADRVAGEILSEYYGDHDAK